MSKCVERINDHHHWDVCATVEVSPASGVLSTGSSITGSSFAHFTQMLITFAFYRYVLSRIQMRRTRRSNIEVMRSLSMKGRKT
jgi:hypothetical protein